MNKAQAILPLLVLLVITGCKTTPENSQANYSRFVTVTNFTGFRVPNGGDQVVLFSPTIHSPIAWNQLVVSWNASAPPGTFLEIEVAVAPATCVRNYRSLGKWSLDDRAFPRASVSGQCDGGGDMQVDTLVLPKLAHAAEIRIMLLRGTNGVLPSLKFLGLSFCNTRIAPKQLPPDRAAWGKEIPVLERSQQSYPGGNGWCSPTSLSMVLAHWGAISNRADWNLDAPEVAAGVIDHNFKKATGNWSFNTAFAGSLDGMRAYVTRFSDISELEDWIAAGIPVIISARYDLLQDGRPDDFSGHLTVCRGFTENGDLVINDPWTDVKVESVRHVYKRENVCRAWATSHNTVYLVYPENAKLPFDRFGHWASQQP